MSKVDPSPKEIREACEEYQKTWSDAEKNKRRGLSSVIAPVETQVIPMTPDFQVLIDIEGSMNT